FTYRRNEAFTAKTAAELEFSRNGYEFLGWAKSADATEPWIPEGKKIAVDNLPDLPNTLYAVWKENKGKYHIEYYKGAVTDPSDDDHFIDATVPVEEVVGKEIYLTDAQINANRPSEGYQAGEQLDRPYVIHEGDDNVIYVLYKPVVVEVVVEGTQISKVYDGNTYSVKGYKVVSITEGTGYQESYIRYNGNLDISATHVEDSEEIILDPKKYVNNRSFDDASVKFIIGSVQSNKVEITPAELTIKTLGAEKEYDGTPLTAGGSIEGFVGSDSATFTLTGSQTEVGESDNTYNIVWDHAKESDYTKKETIGKLKVTHNQSKITVKTIGGVWTYDGKEHGATVEVTGIPAGYVLEEYSSSAKAKDVTDAAVEATADNLVITYNGVDVTGKLNIQYEYGTITVNPAPYSIETFSDEKVYDGTPLTAGGEITGIVEGETVSFATTGKQTVPGTSDNTYRLTWGTAKASNYKLAGEIIGKLTVKDTEAEIVVTTKAGIFTYDGTLKKAEVSYTGVPDGYTVTEASSDTQATDVTAAIHAKADHFKILNPAGEDVTGKLKITYVEDDLIINPAPLTVITKSAAKPYDGSPLTAEGTIDGFVNGESAPFTVTGTQTDVGKSDNTYEIDWNDTSATAKKGNYEIKETVGELEVTEFDKEVTIKTTGGQFPYDGEPHGATKVEVIGLPEGYTYEASSTTTVTEVADGIKDVTADQLKIFNNKGEDITEVIKKRFEDDKIEITARPVTVYIDGNNKTAMYNGTWHEVTDYKETGISDPLYKTEYYKFSGEAKARRMAVGTTYMGLKDDQFTNNNTNFKVTFDIIDGFITIRDRGEGEKYSITAITDPVTKTYTGEVFKDFDYRLVGEGPTDSVIEGVTRAIRDGISRIADAFTLTAGASDGSEEHTVEINGVTFTVTGLYVPTEKRDAGSYDLDIAGTMVIKDPEGNVVTDQFNDLKKEISKLTINPMPIHVESP
ncbi:MAG: hypothetical protein J6M44_03875, partial [Butyrivibrio sp.]|nr:hypothetical protein [Butyrivibrio sp.]